MSLSTEGFTLLGTLKVPSLGGATSGATILEINSQALAPFTGSLRADLGDLRLHDGTNQLPIHVINDSLVKTRLINVAVDVIVGVWGNNATASQPLASDPYGSEAVHQDKVFNLELEETTGNPIDSVGNTSWIYQGSVTQGVDTTTGKGVTLPASSNLYSSDADSLIPASTKSYTLSFIADFSSHANNSQIIDSGNAYFQRKDSNDQAKSRYDNGDRTISNGYTTAFSTTAGMAVYHLTNQDGVVKIYRDGVEYFSYNGGTVGQTWSSFVSLFEGTTITVSSIAFSNTPIYENQAKIETDNINATGSWWIAADTGGAITVPATLGTISYTGQSTTVSITGSIDVAATLGTIAYTSNNATVDISGSVDAIVTLGAIDYTSNNTTVGITGSVDVITTLGTIDYSSSNVTVDVTGSVDALATLGAITYTSVSPIVSIGGAIVVSSTLGTITYSSNDTVISLQGVVSVPATLGTISYSSNDAVVSLAGLIDVNATLGTISYTSDNTTVTVAAGQSFGVVGVGFADDIYGSTFKPDSTTVNFRG